MSGGQAPFRSGSLVRAESVHRRLGASSSAGAASAGEAVAGCSRRGRARGCSGRLAVTRGGGGGHLPALVPRADIGARDPLAFSSGQEGELEQAAALGFAHVLYTKSPGGILASAQRTARFRPLVERSVKGTGIAADTLEAIVLLESAGRTDVIAGSDPAGAAGLTQILAETGLNFLGMSIDLQASRRLTRQIAAATGRGEPARVARLRARRRRVDARFDPARALAGTVRYLTVARRIFGADDLAVVSYHMGIGNLQAVAHD